MVQVHPENITGIGKGVFRLGYLSLCLLRRCYHNYRRRHLPEMSAKSPEDGWRNCMLQVNGLAFQPRLVTEYTHIVNEEYYKRWMREQKYNLLVACICANAVPETWYPKLTPMQYPRCTYLLRYCRIRQRHIASLKKKIRGEYQTMQLITVLRDQKFGTMWDDARRRKSSRACPSLGSDPVPCRMYGNLVQSVQAQRAIYRKCVGRYVL